MKKIQPDIAIIKNKYAYCIKSNSTEVIYQTRQKQWLRLYKFKYGGKPSVISSKKITKNQKVNPVQHNCPEEPMKKVSPTIVHIVAYNENTLTIRNTYKIGLFNAI